VALQGGGGRYRGTEYSAQSRDMTYEPDFQPELDTNHCLLARLAEAADLDSKSKTSH